MLQHRLRTEQYRVSTQRKTGGDVKPSAESEEVAKMLVALWVGIRCISDPERPEHHLDNLQVALKQALPSFAKSDRIDYFTHFIDRRHTLAVKIVAADGVSRGSSVTEIALPRS